MRTILRGMKGYDETTYGDEIAESYDDWYSNLGYLQLEASVTFLAELAGDGRALELGIGTGRVAIPLAQRGIDVMGIDASVAMVTKLRSKEGGAEIPVVMGNFADVAVEGKFSLIYIPFTTFFALGDKDEQLRCMDNAAEHLEEGGRFVLDAFVPDLGRYKNGSAVTTMWVAKDQVLLEMSKVDPVEQRVESSHVMLSGEGVKLHPVSLRYCWPSELDLMATLAGLDLEVRYGGYEREPFGAESGRHVSVYRLS